jgi:N-hydroxyarylamine O-acetyltransferase
VRLDDYLARIGYSGPIEPTLAVLRDVHRHHLAAIAYENLDVICEVPVDRDIAKIFRKLVRDQRGGWCYEMNGLLDWALREIGFAVTRLAGGVMRIERGDQALGNHLVLKVDLDGERWLADVGLGDGIFEPTPLTEGAFTQFGREYRLEQLSPGEWRFHNRARGMPPSFDFFDRPADERVLSQTCAALQDDPESMFRQNLICQRMAVDGGVMLLGRVLTWHDPTRPRRRLLASEAELHKVLTDVFGIRLPDLDGLWERVVARHEALFGDTPVGAIRFAPPPPSI